MNERIKELAEQASIYQPERFDCIDGSNQLEKFAELIIRECAAMARGFEFAVKRDGLSTAMKEHFGVKE